MNNNGRERPSRKRRSSFAEDFYNAASYAELDNLDHNLPLLNASEASGLSGQRLPSNPNLRNQEA